MEYCKNCKMPKIDWGTDRCFCDQGGDANILLEKADLCSFSLPVWDVTNRCPGDFIPGRVLAMEIPLTRVFFDAEFLEMFKTNVCASLGVPVECLYD